MGEKFASARLDRLALALALGLLVSCATSGGDSLGGGGGPGAGTVALSTTPETAFDVGATLGSTTWPTADYTLSNTGDVALELVAQPSATWLRVTPAFGALAPGESAVVTVSVDGAVASSLSMGEHLGEIGIRRLGQELLGTIAARLTLSNADLPNMAVTAPASWSFQGPAGGPFVPLVQDVVIANSGNAPLDWTLASPSAWVGASATNGTLAAGSSTTVQVFPTGTNGLTPGTAVPGMIFVSNATTGQGNVTLEPSLVLEAPSGEGILSLADDASLVLGGPVGGPFEPAGSSYQLTNTGTAPLSWNAASNVGWLSLAPSSGSLAAGASTTVAVSASAAANTFTSGTYQGSISFSDNLGTTLAVGARLGVGTYFEDGRFLVVNGEKTLPIYVWNQPPYASSMDYLDSLGITTYMNNGLGSPEATNVALLDGLAARGMNALLKLDTNPVVMGHEALIGWVLADEPDGHGTPVAEVQAEYDAVRSADPNRPIILNLTGGFFADSIHGTTANHPFYDAVTDIPEVISFDHYPVTGWNQPTWVYRPGAATGAMLDQFLGWAKPCWAIIEASDQRLSWTPANTPAPSPAQTRFEVWDSVIHGATAIGYFTIAFNPFAWANLEPEMEVELARTNGQLTALTEEILSPTIDLGETVSEPNGRTINHTLRERDGVYYLFAANADMGYQSANPTFTFQQPIASVTVIDENRTLTPSGNSFSDGFGVLGVHLYEVRF